MPPSHPLCLGAQCMRRAHIQLQSSLQTRQLTSSTICRAETAQEPAEAPRIPPELIGTKTEEKIYRRRGVNLVGSRRQRAAIRDSAGIPFEQLPYQCFQEARKVLAEDRAEKLEKIEEERRRIAKVESHDGSDFGSGHAKKGKLVAMNKYLSQLKVYADINDPMIKRRFEDGLGDMDKPIYRHLAEEKWRSYKRLLLEQRLTQMHVMPDIIPHLDLTMDISMTFGKKKVQPGEFVDSKLSEVAPTLDIQVFDRGPRLVTIALVDADVPNPQKDGFDYRCHFLATNIELTPTKPRVSLSDLPTENVALSWLPPFAQKGSPYQRLAFFVLHQPTNKVFDVNEMSKEEQRDGFNLRSFSDRYRLKPLGATLFRTIWDDDTAGVMNDAGIEGAEIEFRRQKPEALPWYYKVKDSKRYR